MADTNRSHGGSTVPSPAPARRKRRGGLIAIVIAIILVAVLVIAFFIADAALRSYAEGRIERAIASNLPASVEAPDLAVTIGGSSVIAQYLTGSFDRVSVDAPGVSIDGIPLGVSLVGSKVPTDTSKPVGEVSATLMIGQDAVNRVLAPQLGEAGHVVLGDDSLSYQGSVTFLGLNIRYTATVKPRANGDSIELQPTGAHVAAGSANLDLSRLLDALKKKPLTVCVAQYLPNGATVTQVRVTPRRAAVSVEAHDLVLDQQHLGDLGSCPNR